MLVGKWTLQHEGMTLYINNVKTEDTTVVASANNYSDLKFNNDGSYSATSAKLTNIGTGALNSGATASQDSVGGTYDFSGTAITTSAGIPGFIVNQVSFLYGTGTTIPVVTIVSRSTKLLQLTSGVLSMEEKVTYNYATASGTSVYDVTQDYYYTK